MIKIKTTWAFVLVVVFVSQVFYPISSLAASKGDLNDLIEDKNEELGELSAKIQQTQSTIGNLQGQGATLERAIKSLDAQIDQANYGIRSSEVNIEKYGLELESLGYDLDEVIEEIDVKQIAVSEILRQVQQRDNEGILELLLKNDSLADSVFEIQSLQDLQSNLSLSIAQLDGLQYRLEGNIEDTEVKKVDLEDENITLKSRKVILGDQQDEILSAYNMSDFVQRIIYYNREIV